jgi:DNA-binding MarR family transcriptional regulator
VTNILGRLESAGLVAKDADLDDRRVTWVSLSVEGRRFVESARSKKTAYLARRLAKLGPADRDVLARALPILEQLVEEDR